MSLQQRGETNDSRFSIHSNDYNYFENLNHAIRNTEELGLPISNFAVDTNFRPDMEELGYFVLSLVRRAKLDERLAKLKLEPAFNCIIYAQIICNGLSELYGKSMMLTSGYLIREDGKVFYESLSELKSRYYSKTKTPVNLHAWVTLPNLFIVDPTLIPTLRASGYKGSALEQDILIKNGLEQRVEDYISYQPVLVGSEYWDKAGIQPLPYLKVH